VSSSIAREIGQLLIVSFPGVTIPRELRSLAREFQIGGVTLFSRNIEEPAQIVEMNGDIQTLAGELPLWVAVDQEGGRVARLKTPFTVWPPMAALGRCGDPELAARFARALAAELRAVGVTLDYAPVLDVHTNPKNPVIGDRALSDNVDTVAALGSVIVRELQHSGVAACGKHFPGHGDTSVDSHLDLPVVEHAPDRIRRVEAVPFKAAIAADVAFIMTAHMLVPTIDEERPATLSPTIVREILREELDFNGVILTDDLEMKAISERYTVADAAVQAIAAGCDGLLVACQSGSVEVQAATLEALVHAIEAGTLPRRRVEDALIRHRRAKERFLASPAAIGGSGRHPWRHVVGCDEHQQIAQEMGRFV